MVVRLSYPRTGTVSELLAESVERFEIARISGNLVKTGQPHEKRCLSPVMDCMLRGIGDLPVRYPFHVLQDLLGLRIGREKRRNRCHHDDGDLSQGYVAGCGRLIHEFVK